MDVQYIHRADMDDDLGIVNAARVSMDRWHSEFDPEKDTRLLSYLSKHRHWTPFGHAIQSFTRVATLAELGAWFTKRSPGAETTVLGQDGATVHLLESASVWWWRENAHLLPPDQQDFVFYRLRHRFPHAADALGIPEHNPVVDDAQIAHRYQPTLVSNTNSVPSKHIFATFRVTAPIPIRTQCFKSKFGFVENEVSRRYVSSKPEIFFPDCWRGQAANVKQGSNGVCENEMMVAVEYHKRCRESVRTYEWMLEANEVAPEQARFVLPQGAYTQWIWTGHLSAFARFVGLRQNSHAQGEAQDLAREIDQYLAEQFGPRWRAAKDGR